MESVFARPCEELKSALLLLRSLKTLTNSDRNGGATRFAVGATLESDIPTHGFRLGPLSQGVAR